jgi:serine/threonine protein kinase
MEGGTGERGGAAVLIGIGEYLHAEQVWPLRYAARDAEAMAGVLSDPELCGFPAHKVKLLTDQSASRDKVAHHLSKWLPEQARGAEIALIYFAGHGMIHRIGHRDEGYLLPYDADPDDIVTRGLLMTDLARWIEAIDAGTVIVCLDCCHAAKVLPRGGTTPPSMGRDMRIRPAMLQELTGRGRYLIASCDDGQVSLEAETLGHGLFTYHLLDGIRGAGDRDGDGRIGVAELFEHVAEAVERDARALGTIQKPWSCAIGPGGTYISAPRRTSAEGRPKSGRAMAVVTAERLWRERGAEAAVSELERTTDWADGEQLISILDLLRVMEHPAAMPLLFQCLAHAREEIRSRAKQIVHTIGWAKVAGFIEVLALHGDAEQFGVVLDGLAAFEAHREIVTLLDRLVVYLKGDQRNRTIFLLERKQQSLDLERIAELFRESHSPYQIQKALGQGLYTAAYLARDESSDLDVVVRVLRHELVNSPQIRTQFLDLSRRSLKLIHHNLVLTREVKAYSEQHIYFVVRDYVDGVTLQKVLESGRAFSPEQIMKIVRQLLRALTPLHANRMVHGSIKPSNIFLCGEDRVILGDIALPLRGISIQLDRLSYDYRYAAPENFRPGDTLGPSSDFYALGCVAYELACGAPPFVSDNHYELAGKHVRDAVEPASQRGSSLGMPGDPLLLRFLAKLPSDRVQDLDEALLSIDDLHAVLVPRVKVKAPTAPILGEASFIRYATDAAMSLVSFPDDLKSVEDITPSGVIHTGAVSTEDTFQMGIDSALEGEGDELERRIQMLGLLPNAGENEPDDETLPRPLGRFNLLRLLGVGMFGKVYVAWDGTLGREVAIKIPRRGVIESPAIAEASLAEAKNAAQLRHPAIVAVFDVVTLEDGTVFVVMEYIEGPTLRQMLKNGPMAPGWVAGLIAEVADALHYAHTKKFVHRDIKPANILIDALSQPHVADFGLAVHETTQPGRSGELAGTPSYMSPEQVRGEAHRLDGRTDVWALGVILYELLTGSRPFTGRDGEQVFEEIVRRDAKPPRQLNAAVPRELERICLKCLSKRMTDRYQTAGDLADDLKRFLAGQPNTGRLPFIEQPPVAARPLGTWDRLRRLFSFKKSPAGRDPPC